MDIILPNLWRPRDYQRRLWSYLENGGKRAVAVWHRRAGKDEVCLHRAACAALERVGNYWHMLPEASQARKAVWDAINPHTGRRRIDEAFPPSIRRGQREDDMKITLANGSVWQLVGSDRFDALVGSVRAPSASLNSRAR
jgi:phage terminase large subunit